MSKFNVGDKVRFIGDLSEHIFCDTLDNHKNDLTICKVCGNEKMYHVKSCDINDVKWCFDDEELESIQSSDDVESLYPYMIDVKTCGKNLFDNYKIQTDFYEKYIKGIWEIEEEKDMNKVLNLWCERKRNKIIDKYDELEAEFNTTKYSVVESFNELVQKFNNDLEDLYKLDKATEQFVLKENAPNNVIKYCLDNDKLNEEFKKEYLSKREEEFNDLRNIKDEVEAQLSLSNDLEYQQEVLIRYGIIDKKTKKISE